MSDLYNKVLSCYDKNIDIEIPKIPNLTEYLKWINRPYRDRAMEGIYYPDDFVRLNDGDEDWNKFHRLLNPKYWNNNKRENISNGKPSIALKAFFQGPSFSECASVIQAGIYLMVMQKIGEVEFNKLHSTLILTSNPFDGSSPTYNYLTQCGDLSGRADGNILYIRGVVEHEVKHLTGFVSGWNAVYRDGKYIGFGPETFENGPLTYEELRERLIYYYNRDQSNETKEAIDKLDINDPHEKFFKQYAVRLADNKKPLKSGIIGPTNRVEMHLDKIENEII